jgi:hypothetical protein
LILSETVGYTTNNILEWLGYYGVSFIRLNYDVDSDVIDNISGGIRNKNSIILMLLLWRLLVLLNLIALTTPLIPATNLVKTTKNCLTKWASFNSFL